MDADKIATQAYEKQSRANDKAGTGRDPNLTAQRAVQDAVMAERHKGFDLKAQDNTPKFERPQFAVVGEGTKSAQDAYREGWERTFGKKEAKNGNTVQSK